MTVADGFVQFEQGKPFFDMVGSFMVSLASFPAIFNADNPMKLDESHFISINGVQVPGRHFRPLEVFEQAKANHIDIPRYIANCCMMLANTAYESVKDANDKSPEFEFFRHVRNASSHMNMFNFFAHEPCRPAAWRGATLDHTKLGQANPLFGKPCFGPLLGPADVIDLLADIEKKITG